MTPEWILFAWLLAVFFYWFGVLVGRGIEQRRRKERDA